MHIAAPTLPADHPDRPLACEEALHMAFYEIASREPELAWDGDEAALWPLRKTAVAAGWSIDEVDKAMVQLAGTVRAAVNPGRPE